MGIRRFKLIGIIASCAVVIVCVSLLAWLNMALAVVCILCSFAASTVTYYKIDNKRLRFEANTDTICQECKKQFAKAAVADMSQADGVVNQPVAAGTSDDEVDTAAQSSEVTLLAADETGYNKITEMFINDLPNHLKEMQEALQEGNLQELACKIHELKSLDGFASSPVYSEKAMSLEQSVMDSRIDKVREQLDEMIQLCLKAKPAHR